MSYTRQLGRFVFPALITLGVVAASGAHAEVAAPLSITTYNADANSFHVNAVVVSGKREAVVIDSGFTRADALRIAVHAIEGLPPEATPRFIRVSHRAPITVGPGRSVACRAILSPPPSPVAPGDYPFHRDAWFQQLGAVGFSLGPCTAITSVAPTDPLSRLTAWLGALRRAIAEHVYAKAGKAGGGMSAAMIAGDRSFIDPDDADALRASGLAHLISISGVHMVLAGGIFFFIVRYLWPLAEPLALRVPSVKAAALAAIIACSLYFAVSGGEVATQRAWIMALIAFGAKLFDRPAISLRSLAVALAVVVLVQPDSVVTPGFQMSFAASAALIALYELWPRLDRPSQPGLLARIRAWFLGAAATSLAASGATMPFALFHFQRAAWFSVLANLAATPIISFWTTPAAAAAALAAPFGLDHLFFGVMGESIAWVLRVAHASADLSPVERGTGLPLAGLMWATLAVVLGVVLSRWGRLVALVPSALAVSAWLSAPEPAAYVARDGAVFVRGPDAWIELTDWRLENGLDPLSIDDHKAPSPCPGKAARCRIERDYGAFEIVPAEPGELARAPPPSPPPAPSTVDMSRNENMGDDGGAAAQGAPGRRPGRPRAPKPPVCPSPARLVFHPADGAVDLRIDPCAVSAGGGAVLELTHPGRKLRLAHQEIGRPWSPASTQP